MSRVEAAMIGIDLGGTKVEGVLMSGAGEILRRKRVATPRGSYPQTLDALRDLILELGDGISVRPTVGIGTPGAVSPATGLIKNANSTWLNGKPLGRDLERLLDRPAVLANDADCFALSEATDGAGAGAAIVFGVILGTGVGGGVVVHGRLLRGPNAIGGEWGHNPLPWARDDERPGTDCYCGKPGCIETFLSGPAMERDHREASGADMTCGEIARRAEEGDPAADATLQRYELRLSRSLAAVINVLDPEVIVLGGGLSNIGRLYDRVPRLWGPFVFSDRVDTRLVAPRHGDASGVRGAAWLGRT